jgi:arylsulfatase
MDLVKELGIDDRTIFVFTSDNGPLYNQLGGTDADFFQSAGPLRGLKGSLYEGGFREPMIVHWTGHIKPGTTSERVTAFEDWMATLLDLAGAAGAIPHDTDGISFAPTLLGSPQPERPFLYREFAGYGGQQSVRVGDWVGLRQKLLRPGKGGGSNLRIELYNLKDDVGQKRDVAAEHPDVVAMIERIMRSQHVPSKEFPLPALDGAGQ